MNAPMTISDVLGKKCELFAQLLEADTTFRPGTEDQTIVDRLRLLAADEKELSLALAVFAIFTSPYWGMTLEELEHEVQLVRNEIAVDLTAN